jgi:hypothetical protein
MDEKNTCDGRRADRSCLDYQGVNDFQDTNSVICVHDQEFVGRIMQRRRVAEAITSAGLHLYNSEKSKKNCQANLPDGPCRQDITWPYMRRSGLNSNFTQ